MVGTDPNSSQPPPERAGLHAPGALLGTIESPRRLTPLRIGVQVAGTIIALGLLGWCIALAREHTTPEQLDRLRHAAPSAIAGLAGIAILSVVLNGLGFWVTLLPLRRLRAIDLVATNALATFLAYLPFKLGAFLRFVIHHRRDGVPFRQIVPWLAGYSALSLATLLPLCLVGALRPTIDGLWVVAAASLVLAANGAAVLLGRLSARWPWLGAMSLGSWRIVRAPGPVAGCMVVKTLDVGCHAARFVLAAGILGVDLAPDRAILYALMYFLFGVFSPVGMMGVREGGVVIGGVALFGMNEAAQAELAQLLLIVSATEAVTLVPLALLGAAWLRLDRLLLRGGATRPRA